MSKVIVTGAAGSIGSYMVDELVSLGNDVIGVDNLSSGSMKYLDRSIGSESFKLKVFDLRQPIGDRLPSDAEEVFHFAADPEVRTGLNNPESQFENNVLVTYNVLEFVRRSSVKRLYLVSSSTVYGEPKEIPTPEDYSPLVPISIYGCSKLMCENMALGYAQTFGMRTVVIRPANVVGGRVTHGVLLDFIAKLRANAARLEVLGDGTQSKSYVHATDVVQGILALERVTRLPSFDVFNIGNTGRTSVVRIAEIISEEMKVSPKLSMTGGIDGGRAWKGDVKTVLLSIDKIKRTGWAPTWSSDECIRRSVREILAIGD